MSTETATVVLVHGAWAGAAAWEKVARLLHLKGINVVTAQLPLSSLADDTAALDQALAQIPGPVALAGHAYAGAVIASTQSAKVRALIYIAGIAPDQGETVADVFYRYEHDAKAPKLAPDNDGWIRLPPEAFATVCAACDAGRTTGARRHAAAHFAGKHYRCGWCTALETRAVLVPAGRAGPHDSAADTALHGRAHAGAHLRLSRRSRAAGHGAGAGRQAYRRCDRAR